MTEPAVIARGLEVIRGGRGVLGPLDVEVPAGSLTAVIGPNGAGKTSFLRSLLGLEHIRGALRVQSCALVPPRRRTLREARGRIGYMPQLHQHQPGLPMPVREVVRLGRLGAARADLARDGQVDAWLERLDLARLADRPFQRLSGGEQRKVHLARVLAREPALVLLDEPAGHLDFYWQEELTLLVGRIRRETGCTVIMVTHELRHLPPETSRVLMVKEGRLLASGHPDEVLTAENVSACFGRPFEIIQRHGRRLALIPETEAAGSAPPGEGE